MRCWDSSTVLPNHTRGTTNAESSAAHGTDFKVSVATEARSVTNTRAGSAYAICSSLNLDLFIASPSRLSARRKATVPLILKRPEFGATSAAGIAADEKRGSSRRQWGGLMRSQSDRLAMGRLPDDRSAHGRDGSLDEDRVTLLPLVPATAITEYLRNGGKLEVAQQMANHESARTTGLYDRRQDGVSIDEVGRIVI